MNDSIKNISWYSYLETPQRLASPTKIDAILAERMRTFLRSRTVSPLSDCEIGDKDNK